MKRKLIIVSLIVIFIIVIGIVIAYNLIDNSVTNREGFKFKTENIGSTPINTISDDKNKEDIVEKIYNKIDRYKILNNTEILLENKVENWKEIYKTIVDSIYDYKKEIYIKEDIDNFIGFL